VLVRWEGRVIRWSDGRMDGRFEGAKVGLKEDLLGGSYNI